MIYNLLYLVERLPVFCVIALLASFTVWAIVKMWRSIFKK